jgi:hypothetical protein
MATEQWKIEHRDKMIKYRIDYYYRNRDSEITRIIKRRQDIQSWFKKYKSSLKCANCGENDPICLDFHHTDSSLKDNHVSKMIGHGNSINSILKEISKCEVLCSNCHRKEHNKA